MPVRRQIPYSFGTFFITFTCRQWLNLFQQTDGYDMVYSWFDILKKEAHFVNGYIIMPNHLHCILSFRNTGKCINSIISNGKRFMAYDILNRLQRQDQQELLEQLSGAVGVASARSGHQHRVWETSFDWKYCYGLSFALQKLDYLHDNPCRGRWKLCNSPIDYPHSSARFYATGVHATYPVVHLLAMNDIDLSCG